MKKIAVIGGGIFGCTAAAVLGKDAEVVLFEPGALLNGATLHNQFRHHLGFHYPRSAETRKEILDDQESFNSIYKDCIDKSFPSYYAIAKDSKTSLDKFLEIYKDYDIVERWPDNYMFNKNYAVACFETGEGVYDLESLIHICIANLSKSDVKVIKAAITNVAIKGSEKIVYYGNDTCDYFDYVVDATYSKTNIFREWLNLPKINILYRYKEIPVVALPLRIPKCAITLIDGDYGTILPYIAGVGNLFTVGDVELSIHEEFNLFPEYSIKGSYFHDTSRSKRIIENCIKWYPILESAILHHTMFSVLPIVEEQNNNDGRPTVVTNHGNGCWSLFSGKVVTAVQSALQVKKEMEI